jgi:hypothetical protein
VKQRSQLARWVDGRDEDGAKVRLSFRGAAEFSSERSVAPDSPCWASNIELVIAAIAIDPAPYKYCAKPNP